MAGIEAFQVMDLLARARELEAQGRSIVHMEIGEPDFPTPEPIVAAGQRALAEGRTHYTPALGLPALREAIAAFYAERYGIAIPSERVVVTPGASGALLLALGVLLNPGEQVLLADPGYPCNRHFTRFLDGEAVAVPVEAGSGYQLTAERVARYWSERTAAAVIASPSNPTGTVIEQNELAAIAAAVHERGGYLISDEIYHGLVYGERATSALEVSDDAFVINSFSKYFQMPGGRLAWRVVRDGHPRPVEKLVQSLLRAAPPPAQYAALAAFEPAPIAILEARRAEMERRRDFLLPALRDLGFAVPITPQGAFYIYADCSRFSDDSQSFSRELLEQAGVAVTPGADFGSHRARRYLRFAYTTDIAQLDEGVSRLRRFLFP